MDDSSSVASCSPIDPEGFDLNPVVESRMLMPQIHFPLRCFGFGEFDWMGRGGGGKGGGGWEEGGGWRVDD